MSIRDVNDYAFVHATVRALYSTMLTEDVWESLAQAPDYQAILGILTKTVYEPYLQLDPQVLTPRRAAYQLRERLGALYEKLIPLTPDSGQQLLIQLWHMYEVDNVKAVLRGVEAKASWYQIRHLLYPMNRYITLTRDDMEKMSHAGSVEQAIELIPHTPYYRVLPHALERYQTEHTLFPLEVAVELSYRREMWKSLQRLSGTGYQKALEVVGTMLDIDNLLWALRYRVYHHLSEQEIINYTLPMGYQVHDKDIRAIAAGADIAQIVRKIYPHVEGLERFAEQPEASLVTLEHSLNCYLIQMCRKSFMGYPFHVGIPAAYLLLNEHEIRDLTMLIEAKASQLPAEMYIPMLEMHPLPYRPNQR